MEQKGMAAVGLSAVLYGIIPMLTKLLYGYGLNAIAVAFFRFLFILPLAFGFACIKNVSLRLPAGKILEIFMFAGLFSGGTMLLLNVSYLYISVGTATTLHFLYPVVVLLICTFYYHDHLSSLLKRCLLLILSGMLCFVTELEKGAVIGILFALFSAFTYAVYLIQLEKRHFSDIHPMVLSFYIAVCTVLLTGGAALCTGTLTFSFPLPALSLYLLLSFGSLAALALLQLGSRYLGAKMTSLFSLLEPITSMLTGIFFLKEGITLGKLAGCTLILLAIVYLAVAKNVPADKKTLRKKEEV